VFNYADNQKKWFSLHLITTVFYVFLPRERPCLPGFIFPFVPCS
jgi:hypothetical protein